MGPKPCSIIIVETFIGNPNSSSKPHLIKPGSLLVFNDPLRCAFSWGKCILKPF